MENIMKKVYESKLRFGDVNMLRKFSESYDTDEESFVDTEDLKAETGLEGLLELDDIFTEWGKTISKESTWNISDVNIYKEKNGIEVAFTLDEEVPEEDEDLLDETFTELMPKYLIDFLGDNEIDFNYYVNPSSRNEVSALFWVGVSNKL